MAEKKPRQAKAQVERPAESTVGALETMVAALQEEVRVLRSEFVALQDRQCLHPEEQSAVPEPLADLPAGPSRASADVDPLTQPAPITICDMPAHETELAQEAPHQPDAEAPAQVPVAEAPVLTIAGADEAPGHSALEPAPAAPMAPKEGGQILSVEEIQAMLGIKDPGSDDGSTGTVAAGSGEPSDGGVAPVDVADRPAPVGEQSGPELDLGQRDPSLIAQVSAERAIAALAFPVCVVDGSLHCLTPEPYDEPALAALGQSLGLTIVPHPAPILQVVSELRERYGPKDESLLWRRPEPPEPAFLKRLVGRLLRRAG